MNCRTGLYRLFGIKNYEDWATIVHQNLLASWKLETLFLSHESHESLNGLRNPSMDEMLEGCMRNCAPQASLETGVNGITIRFGLRDRFILKPTTEEAKAWCASIGQVYQLLEELSRVNLGDAFSLAKQGAELRIESASEGYEDQFKRGLPTALANLVLHLLARLPGNHVVS